MHTDPLADMLTRIRNAIAVRKPEISVPHSNMKETVAKVLADTSFVDGYEVVDSQPGKTLIVRICPEDSNARISSIERLSRPGRRMYAKAAEIPTFKQGRGIVVISTSRGVMTGQEAKRQSLGGELICRVS